MRAISVRHARNSIRFPTTCPRRWPHCYRPPKGPSRSSRTVPHGSASASSSLARDSRTGYDHHPRTVPLGGADYGRPQCQPPGAIRTGWGDSQRPSERTRRCSGTTGRGRPRRPRLPPGCRPHVRAVGQPRRAGCGRLVDRLRRTDRRRLVVRHETDRTQSLRAVLPKPDQAVEQPGEYNRSHVAGSLGAQSTDEPRVGSVRVVACRPSDGSLPDRVCSRRLRQAFRRPQEHAGDNL